MADLVAWLTGILVEDEASARCAEERTVSGYPADRFEVSWRWARSYRLKDSGAGGFTTEVGATSPSGVLADIAAKRSVIARHAGITMSGSTRCETCIKPEWPCATLRDLASAYAARPGYDETWRP